MRFTIIIILSINFVSCNNEKKNEVFIIPKYNEKYLEDSVKNAPYDYYSPNNVILIEPTNEIFYHDNWTSCGTGWNVKNPPRELNFKENPLLKFNSIDELLDKISQTEKKIKTIIIASNVDTITSQIYFDLKHKIQQTDYTYIVATRKATNDELDAIENKYVIKGKE